MLWGLVDWTTTECATKEDIDERRKAVTLEVDKRIEAVFLTSIDAAAEGKTQTYTDDRLLEAVTLGFEGRLKAAKLRSFHAAT